MSIESTPPEIPAPQTRATISHERYDTLLATKAATFNSINLYDEVEVVLRQPGDRDASQKNGMVYVKEIQKETGAHIIRVGFNGPLTKDGKIPSTAFTMEGSVLHELPDTVPPPEKLLEGFLIKAAEPHRPKDTERPALTSIPEENQKNKRRFLPKFRRSHKA